MSIKNLFRFAFESISRRWLVLLATIFLCAASFFLIGLTSYLQDLTAYGYHTFNKVLRGDIAHTGTLIIDSELNEKNIEKLTELQKELYELPEVQSIGDYGVAAIPYDGVAELRDIQNKNSKQTSGDMQWFEFLSISPSLFQLCQVEFPDYEVTETEGEECHKIYLGNNFKEIPIGTVYKCQLSEKLTLTYVVAGILPRGSEWISEDTIYTNETMELDYTYSLDNMAVVVGDSVISNTWIYTISKDAKLDEVKEKIEAIANQYDINMEFASLEKIFEKKESSNRQITKYTESFFWFVTITTIVIMLCIQLSNIVSRNREYGIMYANGAGTRDLLWIMVLENAIKLLLGLGLSIGALKIVIKNTYSLKGEYWMSMANKILLEYTLGKVCCAMLVLLVVISVIPICFICRMKPMELIGGERT